MNVNLAIRNNTTINGGCHILDSDCVDFAAALQMQVNQDFKDYYPLAPFSCQFYPSGTTIPGTWWKLTFKDVGSLDNNWWYVGYGGSYLGVNLIPQLEVWCSPIKVAGSSWSLIASEITLSALADPTLNGSVFKNDVDGNGLPAKTGIIYPKIITEPVRGEANGYAISGFLMSDFCTPAYYIPTANAPYDHRNVLTAPLSKAANESLKVFMANSTSNFGWQTI